jgi:hypothetical protein
MSTVTKRRRKKKGGWKQSKGLSWTQVQQVFELQKRAVEAGTPLNYVADIHATADAMKADDRLCKRWLSNVAKNIQQAVRGRGKQPRQPTAPCVTVYEKRNGGDLHAHLWVHVAVGNDALDRFHDGAEINVHRSHTKTADYLTKSRLPVGDAATEASFPHKRQGGQAAIKGARISFNADALAILQPMKPTAVTVTLHEPVQLVLIETPPIDIRTQIEAARIARGLSQREVAAVMGMKQPHYSNAVVRRHDPLGEFARTRALEWLRAA